MYLPKGSAPQTPALLAAHVDDELGNLSRQLVAAQDFYMLKMLNKAPLKPREGMVVMADGVHFNPGSGAGVYAYRGGAWAFLG